MSKVHYLTVGKTRYPYKTGYKVFKEFQNKHGKDAMTGVGLTMEDLVYLHYLGMKAGAKQAEVECAFPTFAAFEDFIDSDFNLIGKLDEIFTKFLPKEPEEGK